MFPVLVNLGGDEHIGHWFLLVLNLRAQRFEVMDSMRGKDDKDLLESCSKIVNSVKSLWKQNYQQSSIDISNYNILYIDAPQQDNIHDCGYFMLANIECWDGKTILKFSPKDIPDIRIHMMSCMLHYVGNFVNWREIIKH